jgi:branched-chain amino acid transport system permease protein
MAKLLQMLIIGLIYGSLYSLIAMGIVLVYRTTGVLNIAHGGIGVLAGFIAWDLDTKSGWPYFPALGIGILVAIVIGLTFEFLVVRRLATPALATVSTLGLFLVLQGFVFIPRRWGSTWGQPFLSPFADKRVEVPAANFYVSWDQIILVVNVLLFFAGIYFMLRRTRLGLAMRAVSDDPVAARLMGIRQRYVAPVVWGLAFGLSGLTTMLLAPITFLDNLSLTALTLKSIAVAFVGGLVSLPLTVAGAMTLAVLEAGSDLYLREWEGLAQAWPFILMVVVLVVRFSRGTKALEDTAVAPA